MAVRKHTPIHYLVTVVFRITQSFIGAFIWILIGLVGFLIYRISASPVNLIIGLPTMLIGIGGVMNSVWSVVMSVFSPRYNQGVCVLCNR